MRPTEQLVEQARLGDPEAVRALVERFERAAIATAWTIVGDFHLSQDIAQESFVTALGQLDRLRQPESFGAWLLTAVRRRANRVRKFKRPECHGLALSEVVADQQGWLEEFQEVVTLLSRLTESERDVVSLRYLSGMSVRQVADELGRPVGTVTKQLSRAIRRLQGFVAEVEQ